MRRCRFEAAACFEDAGLTGKTQIQQYDIGLQLRGRVERCRNVSDMPHDVAGPREQKRNGRSDAGMVIGEEDARSSWRHNGRCGRIVQIPTILLGAAVHRPSEQGG